MTPDQHNHLLRFHRFQRSREDFFAPKINTALHRQYLSVAAHVKQIGLTASLNQINSFEISRIIKNIYLDAATVYGAKIRADFIKQGARMSHVNQFLVVKSLELKRGAIGFSERMHQLIVAYFSTDILNTSEGITRTTKELITKIFTEAYASGLSIDDIVAKLKDTELSRVRARMIARTETVKSANQAGVLVANDTGLKYNKTWLATKDSRTRDDHREVNGQTIPMDAYFNVGGYEMEVPGDTGGKNGRPKVDPSLFVNCRCTTTLQAVRDAQGRLIHI